MSVSSKSVGKSGRLSTSGAMTPSGSSRSVAPANAKSERTVSFTREELRARNSKTDWARVDATTEAEIARMDRDDPDLHGVANIDWSQAQWVTYSPKAAISIRLDADVLAFFKSGGPGYQRRINAVLRSYMVARRKTEPTG